MHFRGSFVLALACLSCALSSLRGASTNLPTFLWETNLPPGHASRVTVATNGAFYVTDSAGGLNAFTASGQFHWRYEFLDQFPASGPATIAPDGTVLVNFAPEVNGALGLKAFSPAGTNLWEVQFSSTRNSPSISSNGTIYVSDLGGMIRALSPTGEGIWTQSFGGLNVNANITVLASGDILVIGVMSNGGVAGLLDASGNFRWYRSYFANETPSGHPAVGENGAIYLGFNSGTPNVVPGNQHEVVALEQDGTVSWTYALTNRLSGGVAAGTNAVYFGTTNGNLVALDLTGAEMWNYAAGGAIAGTPVIDAEGTILFGTEGGNVVALNRDGTVLWTLPVNAAVAGDLTLDNQGRLFVRTTDGKVTMFQHSAPASDRGWAMSGGDPAHTSRSEAIVQLPAAPVLHAIQGEPNPGVVTVTWDSVPGAIGYRVFRSLDTNFSNSALIGTNVTLTTGFLDDTAAFGTVYRYWVTAVNALGESARSNAAEGSQRTKLWEATLAGAVYGAPAIADDGTIHLTTSGTNRFGFFNLPGKIIAMERGGRTKWEFNGEAAFTSTPAVSRAGDVYAISADAMAYAVDKNGALKWKMKVAGVNQMRPWSLSPAITGDDLIILPTTNGISAFTESGRQLWTYRTNCANAFSPVVGPDGTIYMNTGGPLVALNRNGTLKWSAGQWNLMTQPIVLDDGNVVAGAQGFIPGLISFSPTGRTNGVIRTTRIFGTPVARADGTLYASLDARRILTARFGEGPLRTNAVTLTSFEPLTLSADGGLFVSALTTGAGAGPLLLSLTPEGNLVTNLFGRGEANSANFLPSGEVLVGSTAGKLYAFAGPSALPTNGWPTARFDKRQTGSRSKPSGPPALPNVFAATDEDFVGQVRLTWAFPTEDLSFVEIWRSSTTNFSEAIQVATNLTGMEFNDVGLPAQRYYYWLKATNSQGATDFTAPVSGIPSTKATVRWITIATEGLRVPSIGLNGTIYAAGSQNNMLAFTQDGQKLWTSSNVIYGTEIPIVVGPDDRIHTWDGSNWVISGNDGTVIKRTPLLEGTGSLPIAVANDGSVYVNGLFLRALTPAGELKWEVPGTPPVQAAIDREGNVYTASSESFLPPRQLISLTRAGTNRWSFDFEWNIGNGFALRTEGLVFSDAGGTLHAFGYDGRRQWSTNGYAAVGEPIIGPDGTIFIRGGTNFHALDSSGTLKWTYPGRALNAMVSRNGNVYLDTTPGIVALNPAGQKLWTWASTNGSAATGLAMSESGTIYATVGQTLVALNTSDAPSESNWSTAGGNMQRTGQLRPGGATLNLVSVAINSDGSRTVILEGNSANAVIETSDDLRTWRVVSGTQLSELRVQINVPSGTPRQFFRARSSDQ